MLLAVCVVSQKNKLWGEGLLGDGVIILQGFAYCGLSLRDKTKRIWLQRSFSPVFIPSSDDVLTSQSGDGILKIKFVQDEFIHV